MIVVNILGLGADEMKLKGSFVFNCVSDISTIFICLPDVLDEIIRYLVVIACLVCSSNGILIITEHLLLDQLGGNTLGIGGP